MWFRRCCKWWESWMIHSCFQNFIIFSPQECYYGLQVCFWSNGYSNSAYKVPVIRNMKSCMYRVKWEGRRKCDLCYQNPQLCNRWILAFWDNRRPCHGTNFKAIGHPVTCQMRTECTHCFVWIQLLTLLRWVHSYTIRINTGMELEKSCTKCIKLLTLWSPNIIVSLDGLSHRAFFVCILPTT